MTRDTRNRRSSSADFGELSKRKRAETLEGFAALVGGAVRAAREVRCPECGTTDRRAHADGCKVGAMAEMGKR